MNWLAAISIRKVTLSDGNQRVRALSEDVENSFSISISCFSYYAQLLDDHNYGVSVTSICGEPEKNVKTKLPKQMPYQTSRNEFQ